ncbi:serine/threonine protein kinase [Solirubrobacter sp. CPCC 204708]|uniref:non-specific serine/threonine protein kinase n=1 Tax=Solirubrobacter deserti TaxID=2282478 RepID=A0ABT4RNN3_9ACTN|nr:serine/threonine-protein kinase [Solirubrobacter deserti]MBE2314928.1 serine/threonine protein kinase [Solirubrobacter deserti]MDA0140159.1 protein kinase [Solirubrobacter deserti]
MTDVLEGAHIAGCRIESVAGRGGMGIVYRATQLSLGRPVALKLIAPEHAADSDFRERFQRESRMAAAIDHPNVIPVYEAGEEDGRLYIVMRWVEGTDLHKELRAHGRMDHARAARIVHQVAGALDSAHAAGLVHRDVKPANVLLSGEHAYLADFGLTRFANSETNVTTGGHFLGTVDYMAPEQFRPGPSDARADVYALGCVLYAALVGRPPFVRETVPQTMLAHLHDPPPPAPGDFNRVLARALAKDPADRFPSAGDFGRAALAAAEGRSVTEEERSVARGAAAPTMQRLWSGTVDAPPEAPIEELPPVKTYRARKRPRWLLLPLVGLLAAAAVAVAVIPGDAKVPPPGSPVSEDEIERLARSFANAYAKEEPAGIRRIITTDAERVLPNERQQGRDEVTAAYEQQFAESNITRFDLSELEVSGGPVGRLTARYTTGRVTGRITFNVIRERTRARIKLIASEPDPG